MALLDRLTVREKRTLITRLDHGWRELADETFRLSRLPKHLRDDLYGTDCEEQSYDALIEIAYTISDILSGKD